MNFSNIIPLNNLDVKSFESCRDLYDFLAQIIWTIQNSPDLRTQQATLSVYMAFRDHYPSYLKKIDRDLQNELNALIESADPKVIKLRRIALAELSKVA